MKNTLKQRGSALLAVLWMTVILTFVGISLASTVRSEVASTQMLAQGAQGYFLARAGIEAALLQMTLPETDAYYRQYNFQFDTGSVRVEYRPASAVYNVNLASAPMLQALFEKLGLSTYDAGTLARQIEAYRKPPAPAPPRSIDSLEELLVLPAMTPGLLYGEFQAGQRRPALDEVLGVFGSGDAVNVNYARPELLALMPGMTDSAAADFVALRPVRKLDPAAFQRHLTIDDASAFTLIAHGRAKDADFERTIRAGYVRDDERPLRARLTAWHDTN
jgi:type II secretory pathway component PulK